jgi:hypothetical protein
VRASVVEVRRAVDPGELVVGGGADRHVRAVAGQVGGRQRVAHRGDARRALGVTRWSVVVDEHVIQDVAEHRAARHYTMPGRHMTVTVWIAARATVPRCPEDPCA